MSDITLLGLDFTVQISSEVLNKTSSLLADHPEIHHSRSYSIQSPVGLPSCEQFLTAFDSENDVEVTPENAWDLAQLAQEFGVKPLADKCECFMMADYRRFSVNPPIGVILPPAEVDPDEVARLAWQVVALRADFDVLRQSQVETQQRSNHTQHQFAGILSDFRADLWDLKEEISSTRQSAEAQLDTLWMMTSPPEQDAAHPPLRRLEANLPRAPPRPAADRLLNPAHQ
jgi:hypothetical protein